MPRSDRFIKQDFDDLSNDIDVDQGDSVDRWVDKRLVTTFKYLLKFKISIVWQKKPITADLATEIVIVLDIPYFLG